MQAKVLCILLIAASASAALFPPLGGRAVIDRAISISRDRQPIILPTLAKPTLPPRNRTEQQPQPRVPRVFQNELQNLARLGESSSQFVNNLLKDVQKWVDDAIHAQNPRLSTTSSPATSSEESTTDATSSSTDSSSTTSAQSPSSTNDDSSSGSSEEATSPSTTTTTTTTTTPSTTTTKKPSTTPRSRRPRHVSDLLSNIITDDSFSRVLNLNPLGNLSSALAKVDFSKVNQSVPKIQPPEDISQLPLLPGLRENVKYARNATTRALGGRGDLQTAIQNATQRAIRSPDPVGALTALCNTILRIYYDTAVSSPLFIVGTAVLQDGLMLIGSVIKSVILMVSNDMARLAG